MRPSRGHVTAHAYVRGLLLSFASQWGNQGARLTVMTAPVANGPTQAQPTSSPEASSRSSQLSSLTSPPLPSGKLDDIHLCRLSCARRLLSQTSLTFLTYLSLPPPRHPNYPASRSSPVGRASVCLPTSNMPIVNHVVLASGAVVAVSVAVAAALAMYESPELRRYADDIRRRIAMTLHSMGDGINPPHREPRFNRPEDAEGFMLSRGGARAGAEPGVDADDETRRRQREELLYWNRVLLEKKDKEEKEPAALPAPMERPAGAHRGSSFDDFLRKDEGAETGAYVFKSGAEVQDSQPGLRHRGEGSRGFSSALYTNPFADEHHIDSDDVAEMSATFIAPGKDEGLSDIYSATTREGDDVRSATLEPSPALIDIVSHTQASQQSPSELPGTLERELANDEYMSAGQEDRHEAYASIQAWAQDSSRNFYSPLPVTPAAPMSEPELVSDDGQLTPTDSVSLVGSGEDLAQDARSLRAAETGRPYDVLSASEGVLTPVSWSEVGSVISESDAHGPVHA